MITNSRESLHSTLGLIPAHETSQPVSPLRQAPVLTVFLPTLPKVEREAEMTEKSLTIQIFLGSKTTYN